MNFKEVAKISMGISFFIWLAAVALQITLAVVYSFIKVDIIKALLEYISVVVVVGLLLQVLVLAILIPFAIIGEIYKYIDSK